MDVTGILVWTLTLTLTLIGGLSASAPVAAILVWTLPAAMICFHSGRYPTLTLKVTLTMALPLTLILLTGDALHHMPYSIHPRRG